jgi:hypothetical protein
MATAVCRLSFLVVSKAERRRTLVAAKAGEAARNVRSPGGLTT